MRQSLFNLLLIPAVLLLAALAQNTPARALTALRYPFQLDNVEGYLLDEAMQLSQGIGIYKPIDGAPYLVNNYPPLYSAFFAGLLKTGTRPSLGYGRMIGLSALLGLCMGMAMIPFGTGRQLTPSLLCPLLFLATFSVYRWAAYARVDMLALFFTVLGLNCFLSEKTRTATGMAVFFFALAAMTKQTAVVAPAACFLFLLARDWRRALTFALALGIVVGGAIGALMWLTDGEYWRHTVVYNANAMEWEKLRAWKTHVLLFYKFWYAGCGLGFVFLFYRLVVRFRVGDEAGDGGIGAGDGVSKDGSEFPELAAWKASAGERTEVVVGPGQSGNERIQIVKGSVSSGRMAVESNQARNQESNQEPAGLPALRNEEPNQEPNQEPAGLPALQNQEPAGLPALQNQEPAELPALQNQRPKREPEVSAALGREETGEGAGSTRATPGEGAGSTAGLLAPVAPPALVAVEKSRSQGERLGVIVVYFVLASLSSLSIAKAGSAENYLLEPLAAAAILFCAAMSRVFWESAHGRGAWVSRATAVCLIGLLGAHLYALRYSQMPGVRQTLAEGMMRPLSMSEAQITRAQELYVAVAETNGETLCEDPIFGLLDGRRPPINPFIMAELAREGKWDEAPFVERLDRGGFGALVLTTPLEDPKTLARWTPRMAAAMQRRYRLEDVYDLGPDGQTYYLYKPVRSTVDPRTIAMR